ncbi:MAG TPA: type II toxin-antitoxin system ParD family antitoxin [Isosphaeraceae bacterium]|jgi:antitoxin ParD1/3/4|nr:type II toxin-antitoxin system ParD family antitoxin [Isosphaeraceae bacterium]
MTTVNISLPDEMKAFIEAQVAQEGYASASEYLRALIREAQKRRAKQELEAKLLDGLQSPATEMTAADWAGLRDRIIERSPELRDQG